MESKRTTIDRFCVYINISTLVIIAILICTHFPRNENLNFDYMGIIVGVLSLLVAVLVGWQIYTTIEIKNEIKEIQEFKKEYSKLLIEIENKIKRDNTEALLEAVPVIMGIQSSKRTIAIKCCFSALKSGKKTESVAYFIAFEFLYKLFYDLTKNFNDIVDSFIVEMSSYLTHDELTIFLNEIPEEDSEIRKVIVKTLYLIEENDTNKKQP